MPPAEFNTLIKVAKVLMDSRLRIVAYCVFDKFFVVWNDSNWRKHEQEAIDAVSTKKVKEVKFPANPHYTFDEVQLRLLADLRTPEGAQEVQALMAYRNSDAHAATLEEYDALLLRKPSSVPERVMDALVCFEGFIQARIFKSGEGALKDGWLIRNRRRLVKGQRPLDPRVVEETRELFTSRGLPTPGAHHAKRRRLMSSSLPVPLPSNGHSRL